MRKIISYIALITLFSCTTTTNNNENTNNSTPSGQNPSSQEIQQSDESKSEPSKKTDADYIIEAGKILLDKTSDALRKKEIKDSINLAHKDKYYAFKIGFKLHKSDAIELYKKLNEAGITSIYIFHISKKENYLVKFEAKGKEELKLTLGEFKTQLGEFGNDGLDIINLTDLEYCSKNETITKSIEKEDGIDVRYLICE